MPLFTCALPGAVIPTGASRRLFLSFASCERVGPRSGGPQALSIPKRITGPTADAPDHPTKNLTVTLYSGTLFSVEKSVRTTLPTKTRKQPIRPSVQLSDFKRLAHARNS